MIMFKKVRPQVVSAARETLREFWGASSGSEEAAVACRTALRAMELRQSELHELRDSLPGTRAGTTGDRLSRADRMLKRLEREG